MMNPQVCSLLGAYTACINARLDQNARDTWAVIQSEVGDIFAPLHARVTELQEDIRRNEKCKELAIKQIKNAWDIGIVQNLVERSDKLKHPQVQQVSPAEWSKEVHAAVNQVVNLLHSVLRRLNARGEYPIDEAERIKPVEDE